MSNVLGRDFILEAKDLVKEPVSVDEWKEGSIVYVKSLSAAEKGKINAKAVRASQKVGSAQHRDFVENFDLDFVILCACDAEGKPLFTAADRHALKAKNAAVISRIAAAAQRLSGFSKDDFEAIEKNSETTQSDDSLFD